MAAKQRLVEYSDSDTSDGEVEPPTKLRKTSDSGLPPLPSRFHNLYAVPPRMAKDDDPSLHGGRKRAIPHVQGNWPTHVFIEWHLTRIEFDALDKLYALAKGAGDGGEWQLESHLVSELGSELPLHLSLSRPNVLRTEQREGFLETLTERYHKARVKPFPVVFDGFEWVGNQDRTRWFLVLKAAAGPKSELARLLELTNRTFAVFNQPGLYGPTGSSTDGFHVSLAWSLTEPSAEIKRKITDELVARGMKDGKIVPERGGGEHGRLQMEVSGIKVKIGNAVHLVELGTGKPEVVELTGKRKASVGS